MIKLHKELERLGIKHDFIKRQDGMHHHLGTHHIVVHGPYTSIVRPGKEYEVYGNGSYKKLNLIETLKYVLSSRTR